MIRTIDFLGAIFAIVFFLPLLLVIYIILYVENGRPIFYQERVGINIRRFTLIKFRTMKIGTESRATHLIDKSKISKFGKLLRKTKLDELPQLFNVIKGDMSLVGPRPCLPTQLKLIDMREKYNLYDYLPGITGLAQIKGIDMSDPILLSKIDNQMMQNFNLFKYFTYIFFTFFGKGFGDRVKGKY